MIYLLLYLSIGNWIILSIVILLCFVSSFFLLCSRWYEIYTYTVYIYIYISSVVYWILISSIYVYLNYIYINLILLVSH